MADGVTHDKYTRKGWVLILPLGLILMGMGFEHSYLYPLFLYLNYAQCHILTPDADQLSITLGEGIVLRLTKKFYLGLFGALFLAYSFIYAYIISLFGGHRSWASHGAVIGTIGRMLYFSILPISVLMYSLYNYAVVHWGAPINAELSSIFFWEYLKIYLATQFVAWNIGDAIHLILDTEWAKGTLYTPVKAERKG